MHNKFGSNYEEFIFYRTYSRWNYEKERRYNWTETVDRYYDFFRERVPKKLLNTYEVGKNFILKKDVLPSMRALWTAGEALEKHNLAGYNCSFLTISYPKAFADILFLLMNGTGVGFSVERQFIINLPDIPSVLTPIDRTIVFEDSKEGWGEGYYELIKYLYEGYAPKWDLSKVRPEGAILKTFGGRASGARPLNNLLKLTIGMFQNARGRKLNSLECHDLVCHISECVIVGGTRRSACISFSNLSDQRMKNAKQGSFWETNPQRMMANNSVAYTEKPDMKIFMEEWLSLATSGTGERGIFNVESCKKIFELNGGRREFVDSMRTNPCSEVVLRPKGLCNLTEIVVRPNDTLNMLIKKAKTATMLGMLQSTLTDFVFVDSDWKRNCEEERLLGVSLTGTYDHPILNSVSDRAADWLQTLKATVIDASQKWSTIMGVNMPVATTCVKPSGCRPWDGLITTEEGIFTLEDLLIKHKYNSEWSSIEGINSVGGGKVTKTFINGKSDVLKIKLSLGMSIESTPNHMWFVKDKGFVRADSLVIGDQIEILPNLYNKQTESSLLKLNKEAINCREDVEEITQPDFISPELSWMLGYLWGDGAMSPSKYRLRWADERKENLEKLKKILKDIFNIDSEILLKYKNCFQLDVSSKILWHWLIKNDVWKYYNDHIDIIPKIIRTSSKESIIAFIGGLIDADGWSGKGKLIFTTANKKFAEHIQHIGWSVGICFGNSKNVGGQNLQKVKEMYLLSLLGNSENSSLYLLDKHCTKMNKEMKAFNPDRIHKAGIVKEVENIGKLSTFDIETKEHWFYAGSVKSHNTVSQLVNSSSGIHPRYSKYYIRRVRSSRKDPISQLLIDNGVPWNPEIGQSEKDATIIVFDFPIKSPESSIVVSERTALQQLEYWKMFQLNYCEHKPSFTCYVKDDEWLEVGAWCYKNWDILSGVSFLPDNGGIYQLAPYEEITKDRFEEIEAIMPHINFNDLEKYEKEDYTSGSREFACTGGVCEL